MSAQLEITVTVNGRLHVRRVPPRMLLADFLREELKLTGTHLSCEIGACGVCTVLVNGTAVRSCLLFAVQANGTEVRTVESMACESELHPLQHAFWQNHALQCGFCTPGFLMTLTELLEKRPDATDDEIMDALDGVLCRCTGYANIIKAAFATRDAAKSEQVMERKDGTRAEG